MFLGRVQGVCVSRGQRKTGLESPFPRGNPKREYLANTKAARVRSASLQIGARKTGSVKIFLLEEGAERFSLYEAALRPRFIRKRHRATRAPRVVKATFWDRAAKFRAVEMRSLATATTPITTLDACLWREVHASPQGLKARLGTQGIQSREMCIRDRL